MMSLGWKTRPESSARPQAELTPNGNWRLGDPGQGPGPGLDEMVVSGAAYAADPVAAGQPDITWFWALAGIMALANLGGER